MNFKVIMAKNIYWKISIMLFFLSGTGSALYGQFVKGELFIKVNSRVYSTELFQKFIEEKLSYLAEPLVSAPFILDNEKLKSTYVLKYANDEETERAMADILSDPSVEYVEQIPQYEFFYTPDDIQSQQWNLQITQAESAWNYTLGSASVVIALVDDAVLLSHQDLSPKIWVNTGEIPGNGNDDDGNGYIDDVNGWDAADNDNDPNPFNPTNSYFTHGTHCAGIAAAATDNAIGIASMGFNATIMPVKIAESSTTNLTGAYQGVQYAVINNADIISMSWGGGAYSATYQLLFDQAYTQGIVCIAAAGNSNINIPMYPASYNHVISVAATDVPDTKASFSNYGSTIDVSAPGVSIYSTLAGSNSSYGNLSGTSMACPLVSGLASLMLAYDPNLSPDDLEACLKSSCDNIDAQNPAYIGLLGAGRVNALQALQCLKPITAAFTSNMQHICAGNTIQYFDQSNNNPVSWNWSFPGGTPSTSVLQNPTVTYPANGVYNATLIVSNSQGTDTLTVTNYITVSPPAASVSGGDTTLSGYPVLIPVYFTGTPPWSFSYSDGTNTYNVNNVTSNPYYITVTDTVNTTYTLVSVSDANCSGTVSGQFDLVIITTGCLNLIANGDFQSGNIGFTSGFPYVCACQAGSICVGSEPRDKCTNSYWIDDLWDHTFGDPTGKFLIVDGTNLNVWTQNVSVMAGVTYTFSFWEIRRISDVNNTTSAQILDVIINGNVEQTFNTTSAPVNAWTNYSFSWTSPVTGVIPFAITQTAGFSWNDYGIDDIELIDCVTSTGCNLTAGFSAGTACAGNVVTFNDMSVDSIGTVTNWYWDFGDGDSLVGIQNPDHVYNTPGTYNVQLIAFNNQTPPCADTVIHQVTVFNNMFLNIDQQDTICVSDSVALQVNFVSCGAAPYIYQWNPSAGLNDANSLTPIAGPSNTTSYILTITDSLGNTVSDTVFIYVDTTCCKYTAGFNGDTISCIGSSVQFNNSTAFDASAQYSWNFGSGATPASFTGYNPPSVSYSSSGIHSVSLIVTGNCISDTASFTVYIFPPPILPELADTTICGADTIQIGDVAISTYTYNWTPSGNFSDPAIANPVAYIQPPVTFVVEVTDLETGCVALDSMVINGGDNYLGYDTILICQGDSVYINGDYQFSPGNFTEGNFTSAGCDSTVNINLQVLPQSDVLILNNDTTISSCSSLQLMATGAQNYSWYPLTGLSCYNCQGPVASPTENTVYYVVGNEGACESYDSVAIAVDYQAPLFIPNVFSPNGDLNNETFKIGGGCILAVHTQIFNRWGQLVYESNDMNIGWNGKMPDGENASEGTYYYILEVTMMNSGNEEVQYYNGALTLVR